MKKGHSFSKTPFTPKLVTLELKKLMSKFIVSFLNLEFKNVIFNLATQFTNKVEKFKNISKVF